MKTKKVNNIFKNCVYNTGANENEVIVGIGVKENGIEPHVGLKVKILDKIKPLTPNYNGRILILNFGNSILGKPNLKDNFIHSKIVNSSDLGFELDLKKFVIDKFISDCNIRFEIGDLAYIISGNNKHEYVEIVSIQKFPDDPENERIEADFGAYYNYNGLIKEIKGKKKDISLRRLQIIDLNPKTQLFKLFDKQK